MCEKCNEKPKGELEFSVGGNLTDESTKTVLELMHKLDEEFTKAENNPVHEMTRGELVDKILQFEKVTGLDFIVTGSIAFAEQGLLNWRDVKDIDLIVKKTAMTAGQLEMLKAFEVASPPPIVKKGYPPLPYTFRFTFQGIEVNVFMVSIPVGYMIEPFNGLKISKLDRIIREKREMGRKKDYLQLNNYAKQFII